MLAFNFRTADGSTGVDLSPRALSNDLSCPSGPRSGAGVLT